MTKRIKLTNFPVWIEIYGHTIYVYHRKDCPADEPYEIIRDPEKGWLGETIRDLDDKTVSPR